MMRNKIITFLVMCVCMVQMTEANIRWNFFGDISIRTGDGRVIFKKSSHPKKYSEVGFSGAKTYFFCNGAYEVEVGPREEFLDFNQAVDLKWGSRLFAPQLSPMATTYQAHDGRVISEENKPNRFKLMLRYGSATIQANKPAHVQALATLGYTNSIFETPITEAPIDAKLYVIPAEEVVATGDVDLLKKAIQVIDLGAFVAQRVAAEGVVCPLYNLTWDVDLPAIPAGNYILVSRVIALDNLESVEAAYKEIIKNENPEAVIETWDPQGGFIAESKRVTVTSTAQRFVSYVSGADKKLLLKDNFWSAGIKDSDRDLLPDEWELSTFGSLKYSDGTRDEDGNGSHDFADFIEGRLVKREALSRITVEPSDMTYIEYNRPYVQDRWFVKDKALKIRTIGLSTTRKYNNKTYDLYVSKISSNRSKKPLYETTAANYNAVPVAQDGTHPWKKATWVGSLSNEGDVIPSTCITMKWSIVKDDNDGMPWEWEVANGLDPTVDDSQDDIDNDELTNIEEYQFGSHPKKSDEDGDLLLDGLEKENETDPKEADTDRDGVNDKVEVDNGTNPCDWDEDNDGVVGCTDCDGDGLTNSEEEQLKTLPYNSDTDGDGFDDFFENNHRPRFDPLVRNSQVEDYDGDGLDNITEYRNGFNPLLVTTNNGGTVDRLLDSDGDGIADWWELEHSDISNKDIVDSEVDSDGDTLTNLQEFIAGTNPNRKDTDWDGIPDGYEVGQARLSATNKNDALLDFDADTINNIEEYQLGFLVDNNDSDGDGIKDDKEDRDEDGIPDAYEIAFPKAMEFDVADGNNDFDGDFLSNKTEYDNLLNPLNRDSDQDGIDDFLEVTYGGILLQNPNFQETKDSDSDGFPNYIEALADTDLNFRFSKPNPTYTEPTLYNDSKNVAFNQPFAFLYQTSTDTINAELVSTKDILLVRRPYTVNSQVRYRLEEVSGELTAIEGRRGFMFTPDEPLDVFEVNDGQAYQIQTIGTRLGVKFFEPQFIRFTPNPNNPGIDKTQYNPLTVDWDNDNLSNEVELSLGTLPNDADTDNDRIPDGVEHTHGLNPRNPNDVGRNSYDRDGDGILDAIERVIGTNPNNADSNGNGIPDGVEFHLGLDPSSLDPDGDGLSTAQELALGTSPISADSDGDGVNDNVDLNPTDPEVSTLTDDLNTDAPVINLILPTGAVAN